MQLRKVLRAFWRQQKSLRFLVIGRLQNRCGDTLFPLFLVFWYFSFFANREIRDTLYTRGPNFPLYKVRWLREASQIRQTFIPYVKKSFQTQYGRIPIDPAILAAIGHRFIANKKKKKKCRRAGLRRRARRLVFRPKKNHEKYFMN